MIKRLVAGALLVAAALPIGTKPSLAVDKLHVGKAINVLWVYAVLDFGVEKGILEKYGLDVEISALPDEARFHQAPVA
jgi:ABC-type nitrate/sulfonate/bicarbonate transport system substrate-binding protein